eukprot:TRINITY_DN6143_c0_g1_i1.p1 TRINITY_DN6143_c0_g1~~TRINITY_DN6143_c0_g1_i1.p1  ORF type:complete len:503 (-),score=74.96 TRINITY_DN6143_c0_g1_i1:23-1531(-)
MRYHLPLYFKFVTIVMITKFFTLVFVLLPTRYPNLVWKYTWRTLFIIVLGADWWVEIALVVFLHQKDSGNRSVRYTIVTTWILDLLVCGIVASTLFLRDDDYYPSGLILVQYLFSGGYFVSMVVPFTRWKYLGPRPAAIPWNAFQVITHLLYGATYTFLLCGKKGPFSCLLLMANTLYFATYVYVLYIVISRDSHYCRDTDGLIATIESIQNSTERKAKLEYKKLRVLLRGNQIPFSELEFHEQIGVGNFAEVYKGFWNGQVVAIKKLKITSYDTDMSIVDALFKESEIISKLEHKNIVLFLGVCCEIPNLCLITEYMELGSLFDLLHPTVVRSKPTVPIPWEKRINILNDVAQGMNFLHGLKPVVLHRDLKSQNIFVNSDWVCKVGDFGFSRNKQLTTTMTAVGTPQWMAPEVLREEKYSEKADVWSYGVVVWEVVTQEAPFVNISPLRVVSMVGHQSLRLKIPVDTPPNLRRLMEACWMEPDLRPTFKQIVEFFQFTDLT